MTKQRIPWLIALVIAVALVISLGQNWKSHQAAQQNNQLLLNYSIGQAEANLYLADQYFHGQNADNYDNADIVNLIENAAGHLQAVSANAQVLGVTHIGGIAEELDDIASDLSHEAQYSASRLTQDRQFVHVVVTNLAAAQVNGNINVDKLQEAAQSIYRQMSKEGQEANSAY